MKRSGFGAIDLLISLVLMSIMFLVGMNALKSFSSLKLNKTLKDTSSVQEQVDKQVQDIENMRQQTINYEKQYQENYPE